jgi:small-conductance mechanosensitive channel/CRP-like cAMP-binding protein
MNEQLALLGVPALAIAVSTLLARRRAGAEPQVRRLLAVLVLVILLSAAWFVLARLPALKLPATILSYAAIAARATRFLWWIAAGLLAFMVVERFVWAVFARHGMQVPKLLVDVVRAVVAAFVTLGMVSAMFEETITGLITASGVFGVVMGLALQSTLADLFSGIALNLQRPFRVGDWIQVDSGILGEVTEMNWRATHLRTPQGDTAVLPNGKLAAAQVTNFSSPTTRHRCVMAITLDARVHPGLACRALASAALKPRAVLGDPAPEARVKALRDKSIEYELAYWVDGFAGMDDVADEVARSTWITLDSLGFGPWSEQGGAHDPAQISQRLVAAVDLFEHLDPELRARIAAALRPRLLEPGEVLMRAGEAGSSVFIVETGVLEVVLGDEGSAKRPAARLGTGDIVGEMSLLTGQPRIATVVALDECRVLELSHEAMSPIMVDNPEIAEGLSHLMAQRRLSNAALVAELTAEEKRAAARNWSKQILADMVAFFGLPRGRG